MGRKKTKQMKQKQKNNRNTSVSTHNKGASFFQFVDIFSRQKQTTKISPLRTKEQVYMQILLEICFFNHEEGNIRLQKETLNKRSNWSSRVLFSRSQQKINGQNKRKKKQIS